MRGIEVSVKYLIGDATKPISGNTPYHVIAHCCNNIGAWGRGFVLAVSALSPLPRVRYIAWHKGPQKMELGMVQMVPLPNTNLIVSNMIGQNGIRGKRNPNGSITPPINYDALTTCLRKTAAWAKRRNADIHAPRIGCGLAGGDWKIVETILEEISSDFDIDIYIYDLTPEDQEKYKTRKKAITNDSK